jgi:hypothetical protein
MGRIGTVALAAVLGIVFGVVAVTLLSTGARAQTKPFAVCTSFRPSVDNPSGWMSAQLSSGKTGFLMVGNQLCAW